MNKRKLKNIISKFKGKKILVVGDLILDQYIFGKVDKISPEAPVPVVWANKENFLCGGSANVGLNLVALGAGTSLGGILGNNYFGKVLASLIKEGGIATNLIIKVKDRPTTLKTRIIAHHQQVVRVDWESVEFLSLKTNNAVLNKVKQHIDEFDAVIIEDYGKGVINPILVQELVSICKKKKKVITVDPKEDHFDYYDNVTVLTPNLKEAQVAANMRVRKKEDIPLLGKVIMERLRPAALIITLGEEGMVLFCDHRYYHIPTQACEVFDVTGAGDTVIAALTLALVCGATYYEAAMIANFAAGLVVGKLGAATTNKKELFQEMNKS